MTKNGFHYSGKKKKKKALVMRPITDTGRNIPFLFSTLLLPLFFPLQCYRYNIYLIKQIQANENKSIHRNRKHISVYLKETK